HYGTDFATPMNTPVYATGDGIVVKVGMHPLAGHYLVIKNGRTYSTRFLHLNKVLVDVGQVVSRGQKVAFSGNSGRSTGPHLHYELRKNGQPIDAMSAPLPDANGIPSEQKVAFLSLAHKVIREIRDRF
ncbi:M23 family metallopeptidase, partial [Vibrio casei]